MFCFESKIRYSETDENGFLTPLAIINYFQDCSTFQSESLGLGIGWLKAQKRIWLMNSWRILIDRYPKFGETVTVGTFAYDFKGFYGLRHFYMKDAAGAFAVRADSIWVFCDTETMRPAKAEPAQMEAYMRTDRIELGMGETKRKIPLPDWSAEGDPVKVVRQHLDTNHHVNNAQYVDMAIEAAGVPYPSGIRAEYKKPAVLGDVIIPKLGGALEGGVTVGLMSAAGTPYAVVSLKE